MLFVEFSIPGDAFEILIAVQEQRTELQRDLGDAAVNGASDRGTLAPQVKIYSGRLRPLPQDVSR